MISNTIYLCDSFCVTHYYLFCDKNIFGNAQNFCYYTPQVPYENYGQLSILQPVCCICWWQQRPMLKWNLIFYGCHLDIQSTMKTTTTTGYIYSSKYSKMKLFLSLFLWLNMNKTWKSLMIFSSRCVTDSISCYFRFRFRSKVFHWGEKKKKSQNK